MIDKKILLSEPHYNKDTALYLNRAFDYDKILNLNGNVVGFESDLEHYLGENKNIACLSSGTAAIHLALVLLGVSKEDEVLCQAFTFCGSSNPIMYQGATPIFIDSESDTWNMCPNHLEQAIKDRIAKGKKPKAIIVVHLYGMPAKMDELLSVSQKFEIPIIDDAAEALGSTYKGQKCGTFGQYAALSFNGNKIITTSGGGAIVCNNEDAKQKAIFLSTQARDNAPHYQHSQVGYNYRMSNVLAGIGRGQMEVLDQHIKLRRNMHLFYKSLFKGTEGITVFEEPNKDYFSNHWLSCIVFDSTCRFSRQDFQNAMEKENIETRPLWKPMHIQPVFKDFPYYGETISEDLFNTGLCLPSGSNLTDEARQRIASVIAQFK